MKVAVALAVAASPALALAPADCAGVIEDPPPGVRPGPPDEQGRSPWFRRERMQPVDLAGGWVAEPYTVASDAGTQMGTVVTDCARGTNLTVVERAQAPDGRIVLDARIRAIPLVSAAIAAPEAVTLRALVARLEAGGAKVGRDIQPPAFETCGCATFYPELRGEKSAWTGR
ncbi:MAG: hypothetical protein ACK4OP_01700 [Gemmobacter sp.]